MRRTGLCATALAVCALANASGADTAPARPDPAKLPPVLRDVGIDQKLNIQVPLDLSFRDEQGNQVILGQYSKWRLHSSCTNAAEQEAFAPK